ncbi:programmed cell death 1 ligand 2-like isoform X2 [Malaclemys terrapin pileata]|uniref:programmed cell death 1 ligand 2-like isoform X2 n=1 Tax=Malaclemys terrapin pileata TaxID=2991368 RepID=UPI0023A8A5DF|nr:programmed cell death 1 ligand 2-like isoform X2 [Malaclemys terrapin pileata]
MFRILSILILEVQLYLIRAFFIVEVPQQRYIAEYGSNVTMECRFPVDGQLNLKDLSVSWEQKELKEQKSKEVYTLQKGEEDLRSQHRDYRGRATLLRDKLNLGYSVLQITSVKLMDAGSYRCLIDYRGADYKYITLEVKASYTRINVQIMSEPAEEELVLTCQSEGFPLAEVFWQNEKNLKVNVSVNTTYTLTTDGLYNVTSMLTFKPNANENYSCTFWSKENEETSYIFTLVVGKKSLNLFIIPTCVIAVVLIAALTIFLKRKSLTKLHAKKDKKRKCPQLQKEDNRHLNPETQDLIMTNVTDSRDCTDVCP